MRRDSSQKLLNVDSIKQDTDNSSEYQQIQVESKEEPIYNLDRI
jgi:hypothetical protein